MQWLTGAKLFRSFMAGLFILLGLVASYKTLTTDASASNPEELFLPLILRDFDPNQPPTGTATVTLTVTPTATSPVTLTMTPTSQNTHTPTSTSTATATASATGTTTMTPANTGTPSPTATSTATVTAMATASSTGTSTITPANTGTPSPTATATATASATATSTSTPTATATASPTGTTTTTATATPSSTGTSTHTPTPTASPTLPAPTLLSPAEGSLWAEVTFDWTDVSGAAGYVLQLSTTDTFSSIELEVEVQDSEYTYRSTLSGLHYWRVYAVESLPFTTLLVDDDDNNPDVRSVYTAALSGLGMDYDIWNTLNSDTEPSGSFMASYAAVLWFTGDAFGGAAGPGASGEVALGSYLDDGNCLLISSQDYLYDRGLTTFMDGYLGVDSFTNDVAQTSVTGSGSAFSGLGPYTLSYPFTNFSDVVNPDGTAEIAFTGDQGNAAVSKSNGLYHTAFLGYPLEAVATASDREAVLEAFLTWCGWTGGAGLARVPTPSIAYSETRSVQLVDYYGDEDGDALRNGWELHGYDPDEDGLLEVDLPAQGANYRHKDIFVEMDYMVRASASNGLGPNAYVMSEIVDSFSEAPVANPDGMDGISIHLDLDDQVPYDQDLNPVSTEFNALKSAYFDADRTAIYHYMIWADQYNGGTSSGLSFGIPATSFIVTLGAWNGGDGGTDNQKIGTFIHELGHNLGLGHGGGDSVNYKPNYLSIMSYSFQISGVYRNGSWYNYDYQRFPLPSLDETDLDEPLGLNGGTAVSGYGTTYRCPDGSGRFTLADGAIDWNCDGDAVDLNLTVNINGDTSSGSPIYGTLHSYEDWPNIVYDGGGVIGSGLSTSLLAAYARIREADPQLKELTYEEQQVIDQWLQDIETVGPAPVLPSQADPLQLPYGLE